MLVVLFRTEDAVWKSFRNLGERVQIVLPEELNTYDVLVNDWLVFCRRRSRRRLHACEPGQVTRMRARRKPEPGVPTRLRDRGPEATA